MPEPRKQHREFLVHDEFVIGSGLAKNNAASGPRCSIVHKSVRGAIGCGRRSP
jgi:hypothetical protein